MPITINGSGTLTGISTGGLPDGCIATDDLANNAVTTAKLGTTEQSQLCRAWVNFNGTGTVAIRASYNVSSITDNGVGDYTVNFTTAMVDANYSAVGVANETVLGNRSSGWSIRNTDSSDMTTTSLRIDVGSQSSGSAADTSVVTVAIFR